MDAAMNVIVPFTSAKARIRDALASDSIGACPTLFCRELDEFNIEDPYESDEKGTPTPQTLALSLGCIQQKAKSKGIVSADIKEEIADWLMVADNCHDGKFAICFSANTELAKAFVETLPKTKERLTIPIVAKFEYVGDGNGGGQFYTAVHDLDRTQPASHVTFYEVDGAHEEWSRHKQMQNAKLVAKSEVLVVASAVYY